MKQKTAIFLTFVIAVLLSSLVWGYYLFVMNISWRLTNPRLMVITDIKHNSNIYLYQSGFQDRDVSLCIPLSNDPNKIRRITSWRYPEFNVVWSKDMSVIAIELNNYFVAYDFDNENLIEHNPYRTGNQSVSEEKSIDNQIEALINSRGGIGNVISCTYDSYIEMKHKEWKKFLKGLNAGKEYTLNKSS